MIRNGRPSLLNFTMDPVTHQYVSNDPERLAQRITNVIQMETRTELQGRSLEEVLSQYETIAPSVQARIKDSSLLEPMGAELLSVYFVAAKPTPEVAKALEADYRETLLRKADMAIYARRAAAVEEERKIKENELNTEITLEEQRKKLIDLQGQNALHEAESRGKALEEEARYKARARQLEIGLYEAIDPRKVLALAMTDLGQNAGRIGSLTITSEILAAILNGRGESHCHEPGVIRSWPRPTSWCSSRERPRLKNWSSDSTPAIRHGSTSTTWEAGSTSTRPPTTLTIAPGFSSRSDSARSSHLSGSTARFCRLSRSASPTSP